jgi:hypothetical protein
MLSAETVAREDLVLFINACFACTGQREFYSTSGEQRISIAFLHEYVCGNYRRLYARALASGVNHFNQAEMIVQLLKTGKHTPLDFQKEENALITTALHGLPPQRAWRILERLAHEGINNRRSKALTQKYLVSQRDPVFHTVKYRRHVRTSSRHTHARLSGEMGAFLFQPWKGQVFRTTLFEQVRQARYTKEAVFKLPFSIAQGFAAQHKIARAVFLEGIAPMMTERERLRFQAASAGELEINPERLSLTQLAVYSLSLSLAERRDRQVQLEDWLRRAAQTVLLRTGGLPLSGRVAAVLDNSFSASGSSEKKRRPLAVALAVDALLREYLGDAYKAFWFHTPKAAMLVTANGQSNPADRLLDALEWGAETVLVISDACENDSPGAFDAILKGYRSNRGRSLVLHANPVFDAEMFEVRGLSRLVPSVGLRDAEDLATALGFARFAVGATTLQAFEVHLQARVNTFLSGAS